MTMASEGAYEPAEVIAIRLSTGELIDNDLFERFVQKTGEAAVKQSEAINALRDQVDLLTENMMKLQQALLLTNQKLAEFERRQSPIIGIPRSN
jgi:hypothetical protein